MNKRFLQKAASLILAAACTAGLLAPPALAAGEGGALQSDLEGEIQIAAQLQTETGSQTPVEGESQTPVEGEGQTPGEGEGQTPGEEEGQTPGEEEGQTPGEEEGQTPGEEESQTPGEEEGQTPGEEESQTPGEEEGQTPGEEEGQTPGEEEGQTPAEEEGQTPGEEESQTPDKEEEDDQEEQTACRYHTWKNNYTSPTCTEKGRYVRTCTKCGVQELLQETDPIGHTYRSTVTRQPTVDREGEETYTCVRCGDTYTKPIDKLPQAQVAVQTGNRNSGSTALPKLSAQEITRLLEQAPLALTGELFDVQPSVTAPYSTGQVKSSALQAALNRLNAMRRIAGLPSVALDASLCQSAQYGAVVTAANGGLNHYPTKPAGMDESFYKEGKSACSSSNLSAGSSLTGAVDAFMEDDGSNNVATVGHRRWQLNPSMGKVGFGYAESGTGYGRYVVEKVFDRSGGSVDYDFVAWPASGNFPGDLISRSVPWSISLNPKLYSTPSASDITVTVTRQSDGKTWTFRSGSADGIFYVSTTGMGEGPCIIFRPASDSYTGSYTVSVQGLKAKNGQSVADFTYQVDFFSLQGEEEQEEKPEAQQPDGQKPEDGSGSASGQIFPDVPAAHWAAGSIRRAVEEGIVKGYTDGTFRPATTTTGAYFSAFLARAFYAGEFADRSVTPWYQPYTQTMQRHGILDGTDMGEDFTSSVNRPLTRYDMAQMMYNVLLDCGAQMPDSAAMKQAQGQIPDWSGVPAGYRQAVSACYALGLLKGLGDGSFGGAQSMSRAEGCEVVFRLVDYMQQ